jgi:tripartite ATP-independent transporter DctM subunit
MTGHEVIILAFVIMLVLLFAKVPVFIAVFSGSMIYFLLTPGVNMAIFAQKALGGVESIPLLAVPFFICASAFMNYSGVTDRIYTFASVVAGRMNGGLAQVNVLVSTLMGGLSGSALADAAMDAKMLVPQMEKQGYSKAFSSVVSSASAIITPLIPPGIGLIVYGCVTNISIGKLFIAGFGPGVLLCIMMMFLVSRISKKRGYLPIRTKALSPSEFMKAAKPAVLPLCLPIIIIGGVRIGLFTATESGAVAILYAVILGLLYKELKPEHFLKSLHETAISTSTILMIVAAASVFSWVLTSEMIPQKLAEWMIGTIHNKWVFMVAVDILLVIVGMFVEGNASMIVLAPLFAPVAAAYGINEIHFAMVFIFGNAIGALTPPMGTLMFIVCGITKCRTKDFIKEAVPFYVLTFAALAMLTFFPILSTGLVDLVY